MSIQRFAMLAALTWFTVSCGKTTLAISHTLPTINPGRKATADCNTAVNEVYKLFDGKPPFENAKAATLGDGACAVQFLVKTPAGIMTLLPDLHKISKSYTFYKVGNIQVNVWPDDVPDTFKGSDGNPLNTSPELSDCDAALAFLKRKYDNSVVALSRVVDSSGKKGPKYCYIDALFREESGFSSFMGWVNPTGHGEPFHYYVTTAGVTKVVYIHAISPIQD